MKNQILFCRVIIILLGAIGSGCEDRDSIRPEIEGIWQSEGYGFVLEVSGNTATMYDITAISCVKNQLVELETSMLEIISVTSTKLRIKIDGSISLTEYTFNRLTDMPALCKNGGQLTDNPTTNFDVLWQSFKENYAFFELRDVNWDNIKSSYRSRAATENLYDLFEEMLTQLNDNHVLLLTDATHGFAAGTNHFYAKFEEEGGYDTFEEWYTTEVPKMKDVVLANYLGGDFTTIANGMITYGKTADNIGYLFISQMYGFSEIESADEQVRALEGGLDQALTALQNCKGMIVDVRLNGGGGDYFGMQIAGRFTQTPFLAFTKKPFTSGSNSIRPQQIFVTKTGAVQFAKPVVVLTSIFTASAAETFTIAMAQLPQVTLVGERTDGGLSDMLPKSLPNGWAFMLSNEVYLDPHGNLFELTGVPPEVDIEVFSKPEREAGKDSAIEKAIEILK